MKKVRVKSISVTEGGRCSLPDDTIIDLSNPYPLTLSLYQTTNGLESQSNH